MEGDDKRMEIKNLPVLTSLSHDGMHGSIVKSQIFCFKKIVSILNLRDGKNNETHRLCPFEVQCIILM